MAVAVVHQTGQAQTCPAGQPPCKNQTPMAGHGAAKNLPPGFNCNCPNDERRVITIRIDASWNIDANGNATPGQTNGNVWNAVQCARNMWNTTTDGGNPPYTTGYRIEVDQGGALGSTADITVTNQAPSAGGGFASTTTVYPYTMKLAPSNRNFNGGTFTADDLCGRVAHEIGHKLGITDVGSSCDSIMDGVNSDGTRPHNTVNAKDVYQVNRNLDPVTRTNGTCTAPGTDNNEEPSGGGDPPGGGCGTDPCCNDPECCGDPNCGNEWCTMVCDWVCVTVCYEWDEYTGQCTDGETECGPTTCWQECY